MKNCLKRIPFKSLSLILSIAISLLVIQKTTFYRWFGYETIPTPITDEFNYVWQALSLRRHGLPVAWTTFEYFYKEPRYNPKVGNIIGFAIRSNDEFIDISNYKKDPRPMFAVKEMDYIKGKEPIFFAAPFFDHPPLGGLIYSLGEPDSIGGVEQVKAAQFRQPALVLAVISSILLFIFLFLITNNPWIAALSVIVYSTVPTYVLATRTAFLENVAPPFILTHLILLFFSVKAFQKKRVKIVILLISLAGLIGGLGGLAKESACGFLVGSIILLIYYHLPKRFILLFLLAVSIPVLLYISWGFWLQPDVFLNMLKANAGRNYFGAIQLTTVLEALRFKDFPFDGWWIWGFISMFLISLNIKQKELLFLLLPLATHILTLLFLANGNYAWYFLATIPFLAACSGVILWRIIEKPSLAVSLIFFLIPISSSYFWGQVSSNASPDVGHYRWTFLLFVCFLFARLSLNKYKIARLIWIIFLVMIIYKIVVYNQRTIPYLLSHWGNLPLPGPITF